MKTTTELIEICSEVIMAESVPHPFPGPPHTVERINFNATFTPRFVKELLVNQRITRTTWPVFHTDAVE